MGVKRWVVDISEADRAQLEAWLRSQNIPHAAATPGRQWSSLTTLQLATIMDAKILRLAESMCKTHISSL
jgi:hypothetical protein